MSGVMDQSASSRPGASQDNLFELQQTIDILNTKLDEERTQHAMCRQEKDTLKSELQRLNGVISNYNTSKERCAELERLNANLNSQIADLQSSTAELNRLRENLTRLEATSTEHATLAAQLRDEKNALSAQLTTKSNELDESRRELARLSTVIDQLNDEKTRSTLESAQPKEEDDEAAILRRELENSHRAIEVLNEQLRLVQDQGFELTESLAEAQLAYEDVSAKAEEQEETLTTTTYELKNTNQAIQELNANIEHLREQNYDLSLTLAETEEEREELEKSLENEKPEEISFLKKQMSTSEQAVSILNDNLDEMREQHFELLQQLAESQEMIDNLLAEREEITNEGGDEKEPNQNDSNEVSYLRKQVSSSAQAVIELNDNLAALREDHFEMMQELAESQERIDSLERERDAALSGEKKEDDDADEMVTLRKQTSQAEQAVQVVNQHYYDLREEHFDTLQRLSEAHQTIEELLEADETKEEEQEDISELKKQASHAEQAVEIANDELEALREQNFDLMEQYAELEETNEKLLTRITELEQTQVIVPDAQPEVMEEQAEEINKQAQEDLQSVGGIVDKLKAEYEGLRARIAELEDEKMELTTQRSLSDQYNPFEGTHSIQLENEDLKERLARVEKQFEEVSAQAIQDSMTIRSQQQDYENLNLSHVRLRQEKAGLDNILAETRSRLEQYDLQVRMLMDSNAELEETKLNLMKRDAEISQLKEELANVGSQQDEIRNLNQQLDALRIELEDQEAQRQEFVEKAAKRELALRQAEARLIELTTEHIQDDLDSKEDESEIPPPTAMEPANSIEMDEANGPEISDRGLNKRKERPSLTSPVPFSLTQQTNVPVPETVKESTQNVEEHDDRMGDEYDLGLDDELTEPAEKIDRNTVATDGKEIDPADVKPVQSTAFRVHVEDAVDHKELDPSEMPVEIRSETTSEEEPRMSVTLETERRISYVDEEDLPSPALINAPPEPDIPPEASEPVDPQDLGI